MIEKRFCPRCRSENVQRDMNALNSALGVYSDWICNDCGFTMKEFPLKEIKIKQKQTNKNMKNKKFFNVLRNSGYKTGGFA
ncbi:MAG TPA: hypothetical protein VMC80_03205 [Patescibacteria group bacterium]|nr:hypothetical protein [Patescibacteria group bacterium]